MNAPEVATLVNVAGVIAVFVLHLSDIIFLQTAPHRIEPFLCTISV